MSAPLDAATSRTTVWIPIAAWAVLAIALVMCLYTLRTAQNPPLVLDETQKVQQCWSKSLQLMKPAAVGFDTLGHLSDFCYTEIRREDLLTDFVIRRQDFVKQQFETEVIMWMVVTITLSGILLAGIQLFAAYQLASEGKAEFDSDHNLRIEQGRISLKSSVTGLAILVVSLIFFIVYVKWVYTITGPVADPQPDDVLVQTPNPTPQQTVPKIVPGLGGLLPPQVENAPGQTTQPASDAQAIRNAK